MGGVFSIPIATDNTEDVISFLEKNAFNISAAALDRKSKTFQKSQIQKTIGIGFWNRVIKVSIKNG